MKLNNIIKKIFKNSDNDDNYLELEERINYHFKNIKYLKEALTHPSYINDKGNKDEKSNQILEFLGDSVLNLIISKYLYDKFPYENEGDLTKIRAKIVSGKNLSKEARKLKLGNYLRLGKGEEVTGGRDKDSILADSFEAIIGAIFLDAGYETTFKVVINILNEALQNTDNLLKDTDYKSKLQYYTQNIFNHIPKYNIIKTEGPDHDKTFFVEVIVLNQHLGKGVGKSKKEAEQMAAKNAIANLRKRFNLEYYDEKRKAKRKRKKRKK